ncbi:hypothetical protein [Streptomyces lycii]|uniref:hypothetical protein n=1 Tax=Streptomyces lycii TaxID=2654337 RepID=UPI001F46CE03|nr:hypothetical protein [Streptomyces lycii]
MVTAPVDGDLQRIAQQLRSPLSQHLQRHRAHRPQPEEPALQAGRVGIRPELGQQPRPLKFIHQIPFPQHEAGPAPEAFPVPGRTGDRHLRGPPLTPAC